MQKKISLKKPIILIASKKLLLSQMKELGFYFDINLIKYTSNLVKKPIVAIGGGGNLNHYKELFMKTDINAVGSASIFHFTQFTPLDIKNELSSINKYVRI